MVLETFTITVAINQLNFIPSKFQCYCISEMQTLWGEPEQVVTKKNGYHFNILNSTELLTTGDNRPSNHGNHHLGHHVSTMVSWVFVVLCLQRYPCTTIPIKMNNHQVSIGM